MRLAVCCFLPLAVILVFGQTARHDFVNFDDQDYVYGNWHVVRGLTGAGIAWAITAYHAANWHPLTWLSHMLDCQIYHLKPGGHHLTNVLLHAAAAVLLFLALRADDPADYRGIWPSAWVAAVFAIHPLRVESVAWVAERKDVLSGLFFMLTLWFYARYAERPASWGRYLLVVASFALGLTAKPMLVTLPFVLLLLDYWPLRRLGAGSRERGAGSGGNAEASSARSHCSPLSLVRRENPSVRPGGGFVRGNACRPADAMQSLEQMAFPGRVANAAVAYVAYLRKMLYPVGLAILLSSSQGPAAGMGSGCRGRRCCWRFPRPSSCARRKCPYLLFGWLWYLGTLVPVIGLVQVGDQAMADRYTYLTQIGLYVAFAWGAADVASSWLCRRWAFAAVAALVLAGLMVLRLAADAVLA